MTLRKFDELFARRHQAEALAGCAALLPLPGDSDLDWLWRGARLHHFLGMQAEAAADLIGARDHYFAGRNLLRDCSTGSGEAVEAPYWFALCALEAAHLGSTVESLASLPVAEGRMERIAKLDEGYEGAGPLRALGQVQQRKPFLFGGSLDRALAFYASALQLAPNHSTTMLYRGQALALDKQPKAAKAALAELIAAPSDPLRVWESARDQSLAAELLAQWD